MTIYSNERITGGDVNKFSSFAEPDPKIPGEEEVITNADEDAAANISDEELALLDATEEGDDDKGLDAADLDNTDEDGDELNESADRSGEDLDVPGSEDDDENEALGEEDEENNSYSQGADKEDSDKIF